MNTFLTREAAWKAMLIVDHIRNMGLSHVQLLRDGSVRFRHEGVPFHADFVAGKFVAEIVTKAQPVAQGPVDIHITGNAEQFASRGDVWNASNYQHHAGNPDASVRTNDFGDVCHKPDIEGYDESDAAKTMLAYHKQQQNLKLVQAQKGAGDKNRDQSRALFQARRAFLRAKS